MPAELPVKLRVRFAETDAMQVAHYAEYFVWFEVARTELFRSRGVTYSEIRERGLHTRSSGRPRATEPRKCDDEIAARVSIGKIGRSSVRLEYEVTNGRDHEPLGIGHAVHVFIEGDGKPAAVPADFKKKLSSQAAGGAPVRSRPRRARNAAGQTGVHLAKIH
jgi:acyl-CoA thioester hydrolase